MKKRILIDASLTGGRDPAKQAYEFITACKERDIPFTLLTNKSFEEKLTDLGVYPDIIIDAELSQANEEIYASFASVMEHTNFDLLVKFGARTASTYTAYTLHKPFIIVDGGLPDKLEEFPSLYAKEGYIYANKYILTTHFYWKYPERTALSNITVCTYPFSEKTIAYCRGLRGKTRFNSNITDALKEYIPEVTGRYDLVINLVMSGGFLTNPFERKTYGAWLAAHEYDECIGFLRRFFTDIGIQYKENALIIMDKELYPIVDDLLPSSGHITGAYNRKAWNYEVEILTRRYADILVSRATNCIPNIAMMGHGGTITTPVPAHGYMDEDTAGYQAYALGLTHLLQYDDENYMSKLLTFSAARKEQSQIAARLASMSDKMVNLSNSVDMIIDELENL